MNSKSTINHLDTIDPLMRALTALLQPTAQAMMSGGIKNLSVSDGKFVIQLENGHVFDGTVHPGRLTGDPIPVSPVWTHEDPTEDGIYLKKFDRYDDDDEAETYHVRDGKTYTPDGEEMVCLGGIWRRIGDLPNESNPATP